MAKLSTVEKAAMRTVTSDDIVALQKAVEEMSNLEEKVGKLTEKQRAKINQMYAVDPANLLESLKANIKFGFEMTAALQYKTLKMILK